MEGVEERNCLECGLEVMCGECDLDLHVRRQPRATHRCRRNQWQSQAGLRDHSKQFASCIIMHH